MNKRDRLLTIDVGNTTVGVAIFRGQEIRFRNKLATPEEVTAGFLRNLIKEEQRPNVRDVMISSVVPYLDGSLALFIREIFDLDPCFVDHELDTGIKIRIDNPQEMGADRIADVVGALEFVTPSFIVIDSGTATTFDIVNKDYEHIGGNILPGLELSIRSLASNTAKLKRIHFSIPDSILGRNTADSIRSGIYYSYIGGLEYMIGEYKKILGPQTRVIATGGLTEYFQGRIPSIDLFEPNLIYHGLRRIHERLGR